jgi:high-affinity iron transporter
MGATFIQAAAILLREGLEAMLVIAALAAYLDKAGARSRLSALYSGALFAILASLIAAFLFAMYNGGEHNDLIEGVTMLAAAALMLYVSGWLLVRQDQAAYQRMLKHQADAALAKSTGAAVAVLAFLAVFREGAETVLFVHALAGSSGGYGLPLIAGLIAAAAALAVIFVFINIIARKIPLRPLFLLTSAFLFVMALKFIGQGLQEFQEQQLISFTPIKNNGWMDVVGLNPTWEAVSAQLVVLVLAGLTYLVLSRRHAAAARQA